MGVQNGTFNFWALVPSGYGSWRRFCGLLVPNTTTELAEILHNLTLAHTFQLLYGTPHNIDVWVGAISEPAPPGGRVGPLLSCLLSRQFRALRDGDRWIRRSAPSLSTPVENRDSVFVSRRFWWEKEGVFTKTQRERLRSVSLSRIICDNSHIARVPADPFSHTGKVEDTMPCSHPLIPHLDLQPWKEPDSGEDAQHSSRPVWHSSASVCDTRFRSQLWSHTQNSIWVLAAVRLGGSVSVSDGLQALGIFVDPL